MEKRVLVLNLDHYPIAVVSVQKAMALLLLEKAQLLSAYELLEIRTVTQTFAYPAVIRLAHYKHIPYKGVLLNRANLFRRDRGECQYCGSTRQLTIDHVIPRSKGGKTSWTNLVTACNRCNVLKGDKTVEQAGMQLRTPPFVPTLSYFLASYAERQAQEWLPYLETAVAQLQKK
ncbi:MAG: HNH endonuclease [Algoriphagus sp.]|nr:HNH endonuclease [Algoriphagus sp.]